MSDEAPIEGPLEDEIVDLEGEVAFPDPASDPEPMVITGVLDVTLDPVDFGDRFPVESEPEYLPPRIVEVVEEPIDVPIETDEHLARRLEKESMSISERLRTGWE
jgi:hypothetical protein